MHCQGWRSSQQGGSSRRISVLKITIEVHNNFIKGTESLETGHWAVLYSLSDPLQDPTLTELQASLSVFLLFIFAFFSIVACNV